MEEAYVTVSEADALLSGETAWLALSDAAKQEHLEWGRVFIDNQWDCDSATQATASDSLKHANAHAGVLDFEDALFADSERVRSKSTTAGPVTTTKTYNGTNYVKPARVKRMEYLLALTCVRVSGGVVSSLVRN